MLYKLVTNLSKSLIAALSSLFCCLLAQLVSAHLALISSFFHCLVTVLVLAPGPSFRRNLVSCNCLKFKTCLDTPLHGPSQRALGKIIRIVSRERAKSWGIIGTLLQLPGSGGSRHTQDHLGQFTKTVICWLLNSEGNLRRFSTKSENKVTLHAKAYLITPTNFSKKMRDLAR